jgi:hypothetical protein
VEINRGLRWPNYPSKATGYKREHSLYQEVPITYEDWLKIEDSQVEDAVEKFNMKVQERLLEVSKTMGHPMVKEDPEGERQHRPEGPSESDAPKTVLQILILLQE